MIILYLTVILKVLSQLKGKTKKKKNTKRTHIIFHLCMVHFYNSTNYTPHKEIGSLKRLWQLVVAIQCVIYCRITGAATYPNHKSAPFLLFPFPEVIPYSLVNAPSQTTCDIKSMFFFFFFLFLFLILVSFAIQYFATYLNH